MVPYPPPHMIFYECLNDRATQTVWSSYKSAHEHEADFEEVDAANMNSMDDFAKWFTQWVTFAPTRSHVRLRILMVWHAHFLSLACQQMPAGLWNNVPFGVVSFSTLKNRPCNPPSSVGVSSTRWSLIATHHACVDLS